MKHTALAIEEGGETLWDIRLSGVGMSHIGKKRYTNQDRFHVNNNDQVFAVADGVGGMRFGERASDIAINSLRTTLQFKPSVDMFRLMSDMHHAVRIAGMQLTGSGSGLGTTITCVRHCSDCCQVGHLGDSKLFLISGGEIYQISVDHSVNYRTKSVRVQGADGQTEERNSSRTYLSRYLGQRGEVEPLVLSFRPLAGDLLLLCSDGISGYMSNDEILAIIAASKSHANAIQSLIASAECRGGADNQTAVLVHCH